jgi:hypothetical protein
MKTGTKIALGIGGLVLVGGLVWLLTQKKDEKDEAKEDLAENQDREDDDEDGVEIQPVGSEYGGRTIFDSSTPAQMNADVRRRQVAEQQKDWTQDPYYYYF